MNAPAKIQISMIVACRNEVGHIEEFLDSLLKQDMNGMSWEAIIADGMSDDGTWAKLEEYAALRPEIRLARNHGRIVSTGLNAAICSARGEYVLRMDAHTSYAPDYCRRCVEALERTGADNAGGPARTRATGWRARAVAAAYHSPFSTGGAHFHNPNYEGPVDTVTYGCWRKSTLERLGLFDESLVRNQDDELNLRLVRGGGIIWQDPNIVSWYKPRATLTTLFRQYMQYGFWKVAVIRKHRKPGSWRHLVPAVFVMANLLLPAMLTLSKMAGARRIAEVTLGIWLTLLIVYLAGLILASVAAVRLRDWTSFPYLPFVFATYHFSYGLGFLAGLFRFSFASDRPVAISSAFSRITR